MYLLGLFKIVLIKFSAFHPSLLFWSILRWAPLTRYQNIDSHTFCKTVRLRSHTILYDSFFSYYPCSFGSSKLALHVFCFWFAYSSFSLFGGYLLILLLEFLASTYSVEMNVFSPDITRIAEQRLAQFYIRILAIIIFAIFHK